MKNISTICLLIVFNLILAGSVHANEESVYPIDTGERVGFRHTEMIAISVEK
jgi:hypothetical protein